MGAEQAKTPESGDHDDQDAASSAGIPAPCPAAGQFRIPERSVAVRHHEVGAAAPAVGGRHPRALFPGDAGFRRGADPSARRVAPLPPQLCPACRFRGPGAAPLRCRGLRLRRAGQRASGGRPPGRLLALYVRHHRGPERRPQPPVGGCAGPHRGRGAGAGQTDAPAWRDVLPGPERHLADRLAGAGAGQLHRDADCHPELRRPDRDRPGPHGKSPAGR